VTRIVPRDEWGAEYGRGHSTDGAKTELVVHHDGHTRSRPGMTIDQEAALMLFYEDYHVHGESGTPGLTRANPRIAYSFVVMQTGRIYEGCGWGRIGAHTGGMNSSAYGVFFPLNGAITPPTSDAFASFAWLRLEGVRLGHLTPHHIVTGHQDHGKPQCPGRLVYDLVVRGAAVIPPTVEEVVRARPSLRIGKGGSTAPAAEREAVRYLQGRLIALGFLAPKLASGTAATTGNFGVLTADAVQRFQSANGLTPDSIVGARTWAALMKGAS